jgi:uncharacterized protein (DUF433 family)
MTDLVTKTPNVLGGRPVFRGTRVPVETLFENLLDGLSVNDIVDSYETLDKNDVVAVLRLACDLVKKEAEPIAPLKDIAS